MSDDWLVVAAAIGAYFLGRLEGWYRGWLAHPDDQVGDFLRDEFRKVVDHRLFSGWAIQRTVWVKHSTGDFKVTVEIADAHESTPA